MKLSYSHNSQYILRLNTQLFQTFYFTHFLAYAIQQDLFQPMVSITLPVQVFQHTHIFTILKNFFDHITQHQPLSS